MDYQIKEKLIIVSGATSGFGRAIAELLLDEGAKVIAIGRRSEKLQELIDKYKTQVEVVCGDITQDKTQNDVMSLVGSRHLDGALINAGGPPAGAFLEVNMSQWDEAYQNVLRWKVNFTQLLLSKMRPQKYGRITYIESMSVKEPISHLVLSNSLRMAVVGFVKTLSYEVASEGITLNVMAPGMHDTPAMQRLYKKKSETENISVEEAKESFKSVIPVKDLGKAEEIAVLALWLLSPLSRFVTGQTISHDGGAVCGSFG
ncbi:MAG: SDR family oxidoreductase [Hyphomicrobiales bacterium]